MSFPWEDASNASVAEPEDGPWTQFKPQEDGPWQAFQSEPLSKESSLSPVLSSEGFERPQPAQASQAELTQSRKLFNDPNQIRTPEIEAMDATGLLTHAGIGAGQMPTGQELQTAHPKMSAFDAYTISSGAKTIASVGDWMTSPNGALQMVAAMVPGLDLVMAGKFAKDMIEGGYVAAKDVGEGLANGDWQKVSEGIANYVASAFGTKAVIAHGVKAGRLKWDAAKESFVPGSVEMPQIENPLQAQQRGQLIDQMGNVQPPGFSETVPTTPVIPEISPTTPVEPLALKFQRLREAERLGTITPEQQTELDALKPRQAAAQTTTPQAQITEVVGMGGATPEEVSPTGTALKNAVGELERVGHGLPEQYPTQKRSMAQAWIRSGEAVDQDPLAGQKLADELKHNPERGMTDDDSALLLRHKVELENAKNNAASDTITANTPEAKAEAQARFEGLSNQLLDLLDAAKFRGSQWGREGRWRQALAFDDYSLETMRRDKRIALGRELTPEETAQVKKLNERISELERQLSEKEKSTATEQRTSEGNQTVSEVAEKVKRDKSGGAERDLPAERQDTIDHLKERFIEQGDLTGANRSIRKLMELLYEDGVTERVDMEQAIHKILQEQVDPTMPLEEVQDLMSGYGKYKELSKEPVKVGVRGIVGEIQQVRKLLDFFKGKAPAKTGMERRIPTAIERAFQKVVNEAKKAFGTIPTDPARALKSALDAIETRLKNRLLDLKQEVATRQKIVREKSPTPYNDETIRLRKEIAEVQKIHDEIFPKQPLTPEQRLKIAEASAQRQIVELERQIKSGEIFPKGKQTSDQRSATLDAARSRIEALKEERDSLRETIQPSPEPEARQLQQILTRLLRREADYRERLAKGDFSTRARKEQPVSPEVLDARARVETSKRDFQKGLALDKMKRRTIPAKIYAGLKEALNLPRAFLSSWDVSAVLRQGGFISFGHPIRAAKSIVPMFKALASEKQALRVEQEILSRRNAGRYASSKLYLASFDEFRLSKQEEIMMSRFANVVPGVRMSNRAFMVFLNKLRADSFDAMTSSLEKQGRTLDSAELEAVSNYINIATGRGNLGKAAGAAETLATAFFSPRLVASRFQLLAGEPLYRGSARTRVLIASEYARMLAGLSVVYGLGALAGASVELDPRSTDFGKLKFGNTRIDPMMGLSQNTVLLSRLISGKQKTGKGQFIPVRGEVPFGAPNSADLIARFARTKLAPTIGTGVDVLSGKNVAGQPVTPASAATNLVTPLSFKDIYDAMVEQGIPEGTAMGILSLFGMGVQSYETHPTKTKLPPVR